MMRKIILIIPFLIIALAACSNKSVYVPKSYRTKNADSTETAKDKKGGAIVTAGETEEETNFNAPYEQVFNAAVDSVQLLKWPVAFVEQQDGSIRLQEAYVYKKGGKLFRSYTYPSRSDTSNSNINYYLEKVAKYTPGTADTIFTQENLKIKVTRISDSVTGVKIDYSIRPYTLAGTIGYEVMSNGYIESIIIDHMKKIITGKPVAMNP
jgi:hypothetical protein